MCSGAHINRHEFAGPGALADALAGAVARDLTRAIAQTGQAALAVSGGSTPGRFFTALAGHDELDWDKIIVTLVDERWVGEDSDRSNAGLVKAQLLQAAAGAAHFVPLYTGGAMPAPQSIANANALQAAVPDPFAAVVLGMGNDGHIASFFPHAAALHHALGDEGPLVTLTASAAGEPRVTQTLPRLLKTASLYLHIEGLQKAETLNRALDPEGRIEDMPVRAVLRQTDIPLQIYWCP